MKKLLLFFAILFTSVWSYAVIVEAPPSVIPPSYATYSPDPDASDQGTTDTTYVTLKNIIDENGSTNPAIIFIPHKKGNASTVYTLTTSETIPSNYTVIIERGAYFDGAGTLTLSPKSVDALPTQQIFDEDFDITWSDAGKIYPGWWGSIPDGDIQASTGTDNSTALQSMFDSIHVEAGKSFSNAHDAYKTAITIDMGEGVYLHATGLTLGGSGDFIHAVHIIKSPYVLLYTGAGAGTFGLTLTNSRSCNYYLSVSATTGSGIKIDDLRYSTVEIVSGAAGTYNLYTCGVILNNEWPSVLLAQNAYVNGADYGWYGDYTAPTQDTYAQMSINNIGLLAFAGVDRGIYWKHTDATGSSGAVNIKNVECEGISLSPAMYIEGFTRPVKISNIWNEAGVAYLIHVKDCYIVQIDNTLGGGHVSGRNLKFEDCRIINLTNLSQASGVELVGSIDAINMTNVNLIGAAAYGDLVSYNQSGGSYTINTLNYQNIIVRSTADAIVDTFSSIKNKAASNIDNIVTDPYCLDVTGNTTTTYCTTVLDAGHTDTSPLGFREVLVEIDAETAFPRFVMDIDTTDLKEDTPVTALIAWKYTPVTAGAAVANSGIFEGSNFYGDVIYYSGDWIITATKLNLSSSDSTLTLVWNYDAAGTIGDQYLFGGIIIYPGHDIKLP